MMIGTSMRHSSEAEPRELLSGLVERVTFHSAETGFCVLRVQVSGVRDLATVVGHAATISPGEHVQASGTWVTDRAHGRQFRAAYLHAAAPSSLEGIEQYLASGLIRGVGAALRQATGRGLWRRPSSTSSSRSRRGCAMSPASVRCAPAASASRGGHSAPCARSWCSSTPTASGTSRAVRIFKTYGADAIALITDNPYRLAARHPRHRLRQRRSHRRQARHREDGDDPVARRRSPMRWPRRSTTATADSRRTTS